MLMSTENGYVKIYRDMLDNPVVCKDNDYFRVWLYLLLSASHKGYSAMFNGEKIELNVGQLITGRKSIAEKCNISESKAQRILKTFEIEHQIEQQTGNKNRLITILNWDKYQNGEQQIEQQVNTKRTSNEQQVNTNKNVKNDKNVKNNISPISPTGEKAKKPPKFDPDTMIRDFTDDTELQEALRDFVAMRKGMKKPLTTERAFKGVLKRLSEFAVDTTEQIELVNIAVERNWLTVYKSKEKQHVQNARQGNSFLDSMKEENDYAGTIWGGDENGANRQDIGNDYAGTFWGG